MNEPSLLEGQLSVDDRGSVAFVNEFAFEGVKRCYIVRNHVRGFVRAWHAHKREGKFVTAISGSALVCCVAVDDWERPSPTTPVLRFVLSAARPSVLIIPPGFANGSMSLTDDAALMYFSSSTVEESMADDFRFPADHWDPWAIEER